MATSLAPTGLSVFGPAKLVQLQVKAYDGYAPGGSAGNAAIYPGDVISNVAAGFQLNATSTDGEWINIAGVSMEYVPAGETRVIDVALASENLFYAQSLVTQATLALSLPADAGLALSLTGSRITCPPDTVGYRSKIGIGGKAAGPLVLVGPLNLPGYYEKAMGNTLASTDYPWLVVRFLTARCWPANQL